MSRVAPGPRGAPRRTIRSILVAFVPSLLSVVVVSALITGLYVWRGTGVDQHSAAVADAPTTGPAVGRASSSPAATPPASTRTAANRPATTRPSDAQPITPAPSGPQQDYQVVVLNQDGRPGLAATVAALLREQGWDVYSVGDFFGTVVATTVYHPPGASSAARAVAADLPVPRRVLPRFGNLSTTRLTVVLTEGYPG